MEKAKIKQIIGITGGIGVGKSMVAQIFKTLGISVFNADLEAKRLVEELPDLKKSIVNLFGLEAYIDGNYNRKFVAEKVFSDRNLLDSLNKLIHPAVRSYAQEWALNQHKSPYLLYEAALMNKAGDNNNFNKVIVVNSPLPLRLERIKARDKRTEAQILAIIKNQINDVDREKMADFIIENDETKSVIKQALEVHARILSSIK